jgi:catechol 1,2-dioxygenase
MDDGSEEGVATVMFLEGQVLGPDGQPLAGATVDLWHANTRGTYSYFDQSQSEYNLRRRIVTDAEGRYRARSIVPSGYGCDPQGRPRSAWTCSAATASARRTSTSSFRRRVSAPDHADQPGGRQVPVGRLRLRHPRWAGGRDHFPRGRGAGCGGALCRMQFDFQLQKAQDSDAEQRSGRPRALQQA